MMLPVGQPSQRFDRSYFGQLKLDSANHFWSDMFAYSFTESILRHASHMAEAQMVIIYINMFFTWVFDWVTKLQLQSGRLQGYLSFGSLMITFHHLEKHLAWRLKPCSISFFWHCPSSIVGHVLPFWWQTSFHFHNQFHYNSWVNSFVHLLLTDNGIFHLNHLFIFPAMCPWLSSPISWSVYSRFSRPYYRKWEECFQLMVRS